MFDIIKNAESAQRSYYVSDIRLNPDILKETQQKYINEKTANEKNPDKAKAEQDKILDRVAEFTQTGITELDVRIDAIFAPFSEVNARIEDKYIDLWGSDLDAQSEALAIISRELLTQTFDLLRGHDDKLGQAVLYATEMLSAVQSIIDQYNSIEGNEEAKTEATKAFVQTLYDAINAITYQDIQATAVMIGDHGWKHLTQDFRDGQVISQSKKGEPLSPNEILLMGIASAMHDYGYAAPNVSDQQKADVSNYGVDKGHPLLGAALVRAKADKLGKMFNKADLDILHGMILFHENPDKAEVAGERSYLLEGFAKADASAAFLSDKVPSGIILAPKLIQIMSFKQELSFLAQRINQESSVVQLDLLNQQKNAIENAIQETLVEVEQDAREKYAPETVAQILNVAKNHITERSLQFVGPRLIGEMRPPRMEEAQLILEIFGGLADKADQTGAYIGSKDALIKQILKIYQEQTAQPLDSETTLKLAAALSGRAEIPNDLAIITKEANTFTLTSVDGTVAIRYKPTERLAADPFADEAMQQLLAASEKIRVIKNLSTQP